jgi:hypothetical protein
MLSALVSMMAHTGLAGTMACPPPPCQAPPWPQCHKDELLTINKGRLAAAILLTDQRDGSEIIDGG